MLGNISFQDRTRKWWMVLVAVVAVVTILSGCTTPQPKVYRVGILSGTEDFLPIADGLRTKMAELGYVEGENIIYDVQSANADPAAERAMAEKLVNDKVDVIVSLATESSVIAKEVTQGTDIPVVFVFAGLEGADLVASVREPGGNITGVRYPGPEQITRRLEILLEISPNVRRVWIGYDKNYPNAVPTLAVLRPLAVAKGIELVEAPCATIEEMAADLAARAQSTDLGVDAIILMPDSFNHTPAGLEVISKFAAEQKVPLGGSFLYTVQLGAVFGNANDFVKMGELAAPLVDKVLKGTPAGTIPVVTPEQDLWINYKVAQELGLTIPEGLLRQAAEIIR
ncbi:MAG: ABC transporter substrate-binding protein [Anaerolineae bacterium]|nr:ABC transporter substrate-binding protein [Anaerolineae bacterium]